MESKQFGLAIDQLCEEKGISRKAVIETIEAALASAYKKDYGKKGQNIRVIFDEITGGSEIFLVKTVMESEPEEIKISEEEKKTEIKPARIASSARNDTASLGEQSVAGRKDKNDKEGETEKKERFNPEKHLTLEEAKEIKKDAKIEDEIIIPLETPSDYGRIAAQTAKQVIIQRIREAEKKAVYDEFKAKEGEVVSGIVNRIERGNVFIDIGKAMGVLFPLEQIPSERYRLGQRFKVYILRVEENMRESGIVLSQIHPKIVEKLFELEVPEIDSGIVEIKNIAREAGSRSKISVASAKEGIDPIGSCVGQKGARIQTIISELGNEKIDIIEWNKDIAVFIKNSLAPAKVTSVEINEKIKTAIAQVPEDQLSLAIGRNGQNVRLAAKLTGWKIDVAMEEKKEEDDEKEKDDKDVKKDEAKEKKDEKNEDKKEKKVVKKDKKKSGKKKVEKKEKKEKKE